MKISNSKKQLAKIIHENGGWREEAESAAQCSNGEVSFWHDTATKQPGEDWCGSYLGACDDIEFTGVKLPNWHQTILSRDEYFHLYPAQDAEVSVYGDSTLIIPGDPLTAMRRMQDSLAFDAGPTIEQLAAEYRNRKDYADRKQQEADAAKADAEAKLAELVAAGKAHGLVLSVAEVGVESESQIRCFRNEKLGLNPKYSDAVRLERCEVCGHRFGLHHGDDNSCPAEGYDDV